MSRKKFICAGRFMKRELLALQGNEKTPKKKKKKEDIF